MSGKPPAKEGKATATQATRESSAEEEMTIKGTGFLSRRSLLEESFGKPQLDALIDELARTHRVFARPILASTRIPMSPWMAFTEAVLERFYAGDEWAYWQFGQQSADFALSGPYKNLVRNRDRAAFAQAVGTAWKLYYSRGRAVGTWQEDVMRYCIEEVPCPHTYLEYSACGWVSRGLELIGSAPVRTEILQGYSRGDSRVEYRFHCQAVAQTS